GALKPAPKPLATPEAPKSLATPEAPKPPGAAEPAPEPAPDPPERPAQSRRSSSAGSRRAAGTGELCHSRRANWDIRARRASRWTGEEWQDAHWTSTEGR